MSQEEIVQEELAEEVVEAQTDAAEETTEETQEEQTTEEEVVEEVTEEVVEEVVEEVTEEVIEDTEEKTEETTEEKEPASPLLEKIQEVYADREVEGELDYEEAAVTYIGELETEISGLNKSNQAIIDIFNNNNEVRGLMRDLVDGAGLPEAVARNINIEDLTPAEGDPNREKWDKAKADFKKRADDRAANVVTVRENQAQSTKVFTQFATENEYSQDDVKNMVEIIDPMLGDLAQGKITIEFLNIIKKGLDYKKAVGKATESGIKKGRNQKIVAKKKATKKGDGLPHPASGGETGTGEKQKPKGWFEGAMDRFNGNDNF